MADVLVIGAGPAGLASAYYLQQAGITYRIIDRAEVIASTWHNLYPSLRLNTTRFFSHLPGKRFPLRYGIFPTGRQYHAYLAEFAQEHNINIEFGVEVKRISPHDDGWLVEFADSTVWYPAVISATGRFGSPYTPEIPGLDQFPGTVIHAQAYRGAKPFRGQRVLVVGNGPSGLDIATEIGKQNAPQHPALLSIRTGLLLKPRYPMGLPKHAWTIITEKLPPMLGNPLANWTENIQFRNLDKLGIRTPAPGAMSSAASARNGEVIKAVRRGQVKPVGGLIRVEGQTAILDDSSYEVDAIIMATGYRPVLYEYFDFKGEKDENGWALRDLSQHPNGREVLGYPGLYLVGIFYKGKGAMFNFNVEAEIAVSQIKERLLRLNQRKVNLASLS